MLTEIDGGMLHCVQFAYDIECCRVLKRDTQSECLDGVGVKRTGRRIVGMKTALSASVLERTKIKMCFEMLRQFTWLTDRSNQQLNKKQIHIANKTNAGSI